MTNIELVKLLETIKASERRPVMLQLIEEVERRLAERVPGTNDVTAHPKPNVTAQECPVCAARRAAHAAKVKRLRKAKK